MLTLNNEKRTDKELCDYIENLEHFKYAMFQREKGDKKGTEHIQLFIIFTISKRFNTIKTYFKKAHIEQAKGTSSQCRDYCSKTDTRVGVPYELGEFAEERSRTDIKNLLAMVDSGATNEELKRLFPNMYVKYMDKIEKLRQEKLFTEYEEKIRKIEVVYIYGPAGSGKTRFVYDKFGFKNVYRITNYDKGCFDEYKGQNVVVFDEFDSCFKLTEMLNYLDIYPLMLPCRYANKIACYEKVYIISNLKLQDQYRYIQVDKPEQYKAFLRRIHQIIRFDKESKQHIEKLTTNGVQLSCLTASELKQVPFEKC